MFKFTSFLLAVILVIGIAAMGSSFAQTWDASKDFSGSQNPNGVWTYGYKLNLYGELSLYDNPIHPRVDFTSWEATTSSGWAGAVRKNASSEGVDQWGWFEAGGLAFQPGLSNEISTIRWASPFDGYVSVDTKFTGQDPSGTTTDVHIFHNGMEIYSQNINGFIGTLAKNFADGTGDSRLQAYKVTFAVASGDIIDFCAGYGSNGNTGYDITGISAVITAVSAPPAVISGVITSDLPGNPVIAGATVKTTDGAYNTTTNDEGAYTLTVDAGTYEIEVSKEGYEAQKASVTVDPGANVTQDFMLKAGIIAGTITRNFDGTPLAGAVVFTSDGTYHAVTDADGNYSIIVPPGAYSIFATAGGYEQSQSVDVNVADSGTATSNFNMNLASTFDASADFSQFANPNGVWSYGFEIFMGDTLDYYDTPLHLRDGEFTSWEVSAGSWAGAVRKNASAEGVDQWGWFEAGGLALQAGLLDEISVIRWTSPIAGYVDINTKFTGQDKVGSTTDVHVLKNGTEVFKGDINGFIGTLANGYDDGFGSPNSQSFRSPLAVSVGDTIDFCVGFGSNGNTGNDITGLSAVIIPISAPATISGVVSANLPGNPPLVGAVVRTVGDSYSVTTAEDGSYSLTVRPGTYQLEASKDCYEAKTIGITADSGASLTQNFALNVGFVVGTVTKKSDGTPFAGAKVSTTDGQYKAAVGDDGKYSMLLPPGDYKLIASAPGGYGSLEPTDVTIINGNTTTCDFSIGFGTKFDAAADFSSSHNPNGVWTYGYKTEITDATLSLYDNPVSPRTPSDSFTSWEASNVSGWAGAVRKNSSGDALDQWGWFEVGGLGFQPGLSNEKSTIRWTSPLSGYVTIDVKFTGQDSSGTTTDVHVLKNSSILFDGNIDGFVGKASNHFTDASGSSPVQTYKTITSVAVGDVIDFCAGFGNNGSTAFDITGISAVISGSAAPVAVKSINDLKNIADGQFVSIDSPEIVSASPQSFADRSGYIEEADRTCGIKIMCPADVPDLALGSRVTLVGVVGTDENGERCINVTFVTSNVQGDPIGALGMTNKSAVVPLPAGLLVKIWGKVTGVAADSSYAYVDDGSGVNDGNADGFVGVKIILSGTNDPALSTSLKAGGQVSVTGIAVKNSKGVVIQPRDGMDITDNQSK